MSTTSLQRRSSGTLVHKKDPALAYVLWFGWFMGLAGLHRIYMGRYASGILWLLTGGLCGIGQLVDLFMMGRMVEDSNRGEGW